MSIAEQNRNKSSLADTYQRETSRLQDELKMSKNQLEILSAELKLTKRKYEKSSGKDTTQNQQMNEVERSNTELLRAAGHVDACCSCWACAHGVVSSDPGRQRT